MSSEKTTDQRAAERVPVAYPIEFSVVGAGNAGTSRVLDSSETGLRFAADASIESGADVTLRLPPLREGMPRLTRLAPVVRCEPAKDGNGFAIACVYD